VHKTVVVNLVQVVKVIIGQNRQKTSFLSRLGRKDVGILLVYNGRLTHATLSRKMSRQSDVDQPRSYLKWSWLLARKNERNLRKVKENDDFSHQFNCNYALFYLLLRIVTNG